MDYYCAFCEEEQEEGLKAFLREHGIFACFPKAERHFRIQQQNILTLKPLMKGTVLLESEASAQELLIWLKRESGIEVCQIERLTEEAYRTICSLLDQNEVVKMSKGISDNKRPIIQIGPLKGKETLIRKTNRHKRIAELDIWLNGKSILAGLEITEKR